MNVKKGDRVAWNTPHGVMIGTVKSADPFNAQVEIQQPTHPVKVNTEVLRSPTPEDLDENEHFYDNPFNYEEFRSNK